MGSHVFVRHLALALFGIAACAGAPRSAHAGDPAAEAALKEATAKVDELDKQVHEHLTTTEGDDQLRVDLAKAERLATELSDAKLKTRCLDMIGAILKGTTHDDLERTAIKSLGNLAQPETGRFLVSYLQQLTPDENPPLLIDAVDAAAKIKSEATVQPLLTLVEKSDVLPIAVVAIKALGNFGAAKRLRERILDSLVGTVEKDRPGISGHVNPRGATRLRTGEDARNRYAALAGEMTATLNKLTGQNIASPEEWFELRKQNKTNLGQLFSDK